MTSASAFVRSVVRPYSPEGSRIITTSGDGIARIWEAASGNAVAVLQGHERRVNSATFSPDGSRTITASDDETARLWDAGTGKEIAVLRGHEKLGKIRGLQRRWFTHRHSLT